MNTFGLSNSQRKLLIQIIKSHVLPQQKITVWIFGSRARGDHRKNSDVDLLLEGSPEWTDEQIEALRDALEESDFPYKTDLVRPSEIYPAYCQVIVQEKVRLLAL